MTAKGNAMFGCLVVLFLLPLRFAIGMLAGYGLYDATGSVAWGMFTALLVDFLLDVGINIVRKMSA